MKQENSQASEWKVSSNPIGGKMLYQAYRIIDTRRTDHSGNRENQGGFLEDREEAQAIADALNKRAQNE
jgi:hypothetical protein